MLSLSKLPSSTAAAPVCVCVPVYNGERYLEACLQSIAAQTYRDFTVIVVDNASTDGTADLCASFDDPRFFYTRNEQNIGSNRNHSRCLDLTSSRYVKLFSADDVLLPDTLALQVAALDAHPTAGLATSDCIVTGPTLEPRSTTHYLPGLQTGTAAIATCVGRIENLIGGPSNTLLRREVVGDMRFDPTYKWLADLEFHCRVLKHSNYINIDQPGFLYRRHEATDSEIGCPIDVRIRDEEAFVKAYARSLTPYSRLYWRQLKRTVKRALR